MRYKIWCARRNAKVLSRFNASVINAFVDNAKVGSFQNGKEVK